MKAGWTGFFPGREQGSRAFTQALIGLRPGVAPAAPAPPASCDGTGRPLVHPQHRGSRCRRRGDRRFCPGGGGRYSSPRRSRRARSCTPIRHWPGAAPSASSSTSSRVCRQSSGARSGSCACGSARAPSSTFFSRAGCNRPATPQRHGCGRGAAQLKQLGGALVASEIAESLAWAPKDFVADVLRFAGEFAAQRPRVVHGWQDGVGLAAGFAALAVGVPRIVVAGRNVRPANFSYYRPYMRTAYWLLAAEPRVILCNNSAAGASDYAAWLGMDPMRIRVVRNGIDEGRVRRIQGAEVKAFRHALGVPDGCPVDRLDLPALPGEAAASVGACGAIDRRAFARGAFCRVRLGLDGEALRPRGQPARPRQPAQADAADAGALARPLRPRRIRADIAVRGHAQRRARGRPCRRACRGDGRGRRRRNGARRPHRLRGARSRRP